MPAGAVRGVFTLLQATAIGDRWGRSTTGASTGCCPPPVILATALAPWAGAALAEALGGCRDGTRPSPLAKRWSLTNSRPANPLGGQAGSLPLPVEQTPSPHRNDSYILCVSNSNQNRSLTHGRFISNEYQCVAGRQRHVQPGIMACWTQSVNLSQNQQRKGFDDPHRGHGHIKTPAGWA
jgi:hypothetical protein